MRKELQANIARRMTPQPVKIRADVEVTCFGYEGIDAVKKALRAGEAVSTEQIPIKIKLVAPPLYVLITNSTDKVGGIALMEQALEKITESIRANGGEVNIKMRPKTVSEVEDTRVGAAHGPCREGERRGRGRRGLGRRRIRKHIHGIFVSVSSTCPVNHRGHVQALAASKLICELERERYGCQHRSISA